MERGAQNDGRFSATVQRDFRTFLGDLASFLQNQSLACKLNRSSGVHRCAFSDFGRVWWRLVAFGGVWFGGVWWLF